jgi:putative SOS response-associated peptidase YedK
MCSRFEYEIGKALLLKRFGLTVPPNADQLKSEIRPTDDALVMTGPKEAKVFKWGFRVDWSPTPLINVRSETVLEKNTFRPMLNNRCLVPASAWFEWRKEDSKKYKNRIGLDGNTPIAFGGLYHDGRFSILTCAPHADIAHIHSRMPVIISPEDFSDWLDTSIPTAQLHKLMHAPSQADFITNEIKPKTQQMSLF